MFNGIQCDESFGVCVCYLPPANSSRGYTAVEFFDHLAGTVSSLHDVDKLCICGDFTARCGSLSDYQGSTGACTIPCRSVVDMSSPNGHGRDLIDFLLTNNMCMLNGRGIYQNTYTSISTRGSAVVDYCLVPIQCYDDFKNFEVLEILELCDKLNINIPCKVPDHSLLVWSLQLNKNTLANYTPQSAHQTRKVMSENFL